MRISKEIVLGCLLGFAGVVRADDPKTVKKVQDMNRAAMEDYDLLEFEDAKKQLNQAMVLIKQSKMEKSPVAAKTHMDLAVVYAGGLNDNDDALLEMMSAIEIDGTIKLDPAYKSPELQKIFDQAKTSVGTGGSAPSGGGDDTTKPPVDNTPPPPATVTGLQHTAVEDAKGGDAIPINVKVGSDVKAKQIVLYYRAKGDEDYTPVAMKNTSGIDWAGEIPNTATSKDAVHYYIEAKNANGKVLASVASSGSPNIISITLPKKVKPDEDENPLGNKTHKTDGDDDAGGGGGGGGGGGDDSSNVTTTVHPAAKHKLFIAVGLGTGGGFVSGGKTEVSGEPVTCCLAPSPLHIMPEIGFWLTPQMVISAYGRIGLPLGANVPGAATLAPAGFARFTYLFRPTGDGFFVHGDLGGGFIRDTIKLKSNGSSGVAGDTDTFVSGPLFVGTGAGWMKSLSNNVAFLAEANLELGIPIISSIGGGTGPGAPPPVKPFFAVNIDLTLGMSFSF